MEKQGKIKKGVTPSVVSGKKATYITSSGEAIKKEEKNAKVSLQKISSKLK